MMEAKYFFLKDTPHKKKRKQSKADKYGNFRQIKGNLRFFCFVFLLPLVPWEAIQTMSLKTKAEELLLWLSRNESDQHIWGCGFDLWPRSRASICCRCGPKKKKKKKLGNPKSCFWPVQFQIWGFVTSWTREKMPNSFGSNSSVT